MELITGLLFLAAILTLWYKSRKKSPPGPYRVPLLGSLPFLDLRKGVVGWVLDRNITQHKICSIGLFAMEEIFVVNDFDLSKELFARDEFSGRPVSKLTLLHRFYQRKAQGIIFTENTQWTAQRRFSLKTLKDFGFGKQSLEEAINLEIDCLIEEFECCHGDFKMATNFNVPIINILWQLAANMRFTKEDSKGIEMVEKVNSIFSNGVIPVLLPMWINKMFPRMTGYSERVEVLQEQKKYVRDIIDEHKKNIDSNNPRDFIDVYLQEMEIQKKNEVQFNEEELGSILVDFFQAGTETSSTTLKWIVLYLCLYQDVQDR
jgi:methyl farnesoate epoxidase/farnesoate epoxidase